MGGGGSVNKNQYGQGEATLTNDGRRVHKCIIISTTYQCAYLEHDTCAKDCYSGQTVHVECTKANVPQAVRACNDI